MHHHQRLLKISLRLVIFVSILAETCCSAAEYSPYPEKLASILEEITPGIEQALKEKDLELGAPVFIRIFKLPGQLEVWLEKQGRYHLFKTYPICSYSGYLGPKLHEGDWQSPEGFYRVSPAQMNPHSSYHLSFNIGYPNDYDTLLQRNGGEIMVHGGCSSMGCFAMGDHRMEEIYALAHFAFLNGQEAFDIHVFPFPMTNENMNKFRFSPWIGFWKNLRDGYTAFEQTRQVPVIRAEQGTYLIAQPVKLAGSPSPR